MYRTTWPAIVALLALAAGCGTAPEDVTPEDLFGAWRSDKVSDTIESAYLVFSLSNAFYPELAGKSYAYRAYWTQSGITTLQQTGTFELSGGQLITHLSNGINTYANDIISLRGDTLVLESGTTETGERTWTRVDSSPLNDELATYQPLQTLAAGYMYEDYQEHAAMIVGGELVRLEAPSEEEHTEASAVAVTGEDIYAAGKGHPSGAVYLWRNGDLVYPDPYYLPVLEERAYIVVGLVADGSEVVVIVKYYDNNDWPYLLGYYRNGVWTEMPTSEEYYVVSFDSAALVDGKLSILATGTNGGISDAMLWEDDHWTMLPGSYTVGHDLVVVGSDTYVTGRVSVDGVTYLPALWKNGEAVDIPDEGYSVDQMCVELVVVDGIPEAYAFGGPNWMLRDGEISEWTPPGMIGDSDSYITDMAWIGGAYFVNGYRYVLAEGTVAFLQEAFTYRLSPDLTTVALVPAFECPQGFHAVASVTLPAEGS